MREFNDNLDQKLNTPGQQAVREVVRSLPEETVSLAWRSSLNEELLKMAKPRRPWYTLMWRPAVALAFAGALATVALLRTPEVAPNRDVRMEAALLAAHEQATALTEVTGSGLTPVEVAYGVNQAPVRIEEFSEVDIESL
jgi:hypothetical protein